MPLCWIVVAPHRLCSQTGPDGEAIFNSSCSGCHGSEGTGGRGPSLRGELRVGNQASDIQKVLQNGIPGTGMPKFDFDEDDLRAVVSYVQSLSRSTSTHHPDGDPSNGKRIYDARGCSGCHKIGNEGSAFGPNLTRIGSARSYDYLKTSILDPSADVPEDYQGITVVTRDGKQHQGVRVNEDSFTLQMRLRDQTFMSFDKQSLQREIMETQSPMPSYRLGERELRDLLVS
jgi:putative heme-binding domain-containing protein